MAYKNPNDERAREARRRHYEANREQYYARNAEKKAAMLAEVRRRKDKPCMDCGVRYPHWVMDFDHRPGEIKLYAPSRLQDVGSWSKMEAELAKCDVVCSNCHRDRTYQRLKSGEPVP